MAYPASPTTLLQIDGIDFSDYATRGITASLTHIGAISQARRDCRGELVDLSLDQFRKYRLSVSCTDHEAPDLSGVWPGKSVSVTLFDGLGVEEHTGTDTAMTLTMLVISYETQREEWEASTAWQIELEEV